MVGLGGEPLLAVDDPLVAVGLGMGREDQGGVGAALRFGHREARHDLVRQQRVEEGLLLLVGAVVREDLGISGVRRLAAENDRAEARHAELLVHQCEFELAVALSAQFGAQVAGPQSTLLDLGL